jgi:hypothetical protein
MVCLTTAVQGAVLLSDDFSSNTLDSDGGFLVGDVGDGWWHHAGAWSVSGGSVKATGDTDDVASEGALAQAVSVGSAVGGLLTLTFDYDLAAAGESLSVFLIGSQTTTEFDALTTARLGNVWHVAESGSGRYQYLETDSGVAAYVVSTEFVGGQTVSDSPATSYFGEITGQPQYPYFAKISGGTSGTYSNTVSLSQWGFAVEDFDHIQLVFARDAVAGSEVTIDNVTLSAVEVPPVTWDGGASGLWDTAANWDTDTVPALGDMVIISNAAVSLTLGGDYNPGVVNLQEGASLDVSDGNVARFTAAGGPTFNVASNANFGAGDDFFDMRGCTLNFDSGATADLGTWECKNAATLQFNLEAAGFTTIDTGRLKPEMSLDNFTWVVDMTNYTGGAQTITLLDFATNDGNLVDMTAAGFQTGTLTILNSGAFDGCSLAWNESTLAVELTIDADEPPVVLDDPESATASSNYNNAPWTSATNLYDGTVTAADIGTTDNQGGQYAGWFWGPHHVVYDMGSNVTFNSILYAQRDPGAAANQIVFWVTDTDPGHATNLTFQSGGVYAEVDVTNVSDSNLTEYELGGSLSGRYVVMNIRSSHQNAGGMELVLANDPDAPADPISPLPVLPSIVWENDMSANPANAPEPNWVVRGTDDNYTMDGGLLKLLAGDATLLDSRPQDYFEGMTTIDLVWRATSVTSADPEASIGAGIWCNVNNDAPSYGAIHFDAHLLGDNTQTVVIHHGGMDPHVTLTGFSTGMLTLHVEVDSELGIYTYMVTDGTLTQRGTEGYDELGATGDPSHFTLFALNGQSAEVDYIQINANAVSASQLYDSWVASYGLTDDDALPGADVEYDGLGDGYDNLMEYVLGGNPTNDDASAIAPAIFVADDGGTDYFYQVNQERTGDTSLTITYGTKTDLVTAPLWDSGDVEFVGESATVDSYKTITNRTEAAADAKFVMMKAEK